MPVTHLRAQYLERIAILTCSNGVLDTNEVCDDSNNVSGDGCSADCLSNETCGNGYVDSAIGEMCDDGNLDDGDECPSLCWHGDCGDGLIGPDEVCDDGNNVSCDGCSSACHSIEVCGNGILDSCSEVCDGAGESKTCNADCTIAACGDGIINETAGESCDDGNIMSGDGCSDTCMTEG